MTIDRRWQIANQWLEDSQSKWMVFLCDAFEGMKLIPDESIDLIITDPAYESLEKHRDSKARIKKYERDKAAGKLNGTRIPRLRDWFEIMPNEKFPELLDQYYRIMAENSHCYIFCDDETSDVIKTCVDAQGKFKWWKRIVWDKMRRGQGYHYSNQHEFIVFLEKGKRKLNDFSYTSVLQCKRVSKKSLGGRYPGPAEKPVSLIEKLVLNSSNPGEIVFDSFLGRGATGVAAVSNEREFLGFDLDKKAVRISRNRMRNIEVIKI